MPDNQLTVSLSEQSSALILGSLLGDGSLKRYKGYENARFSFRHSTKQSNYFYWKVSQLKEISGKNAIFLQKPNGYSINSKLQYRSKSLPALTELYRLTHEDGHFQIKRKWLNRMNSFSLAVWWLDDGSLISNTRKGVFCTDGFDEQSVKKLANYLKVVWSISTTVGPVQAKPDGLKDQYFRIWIRSTDELKKLLRLVAPHVQEIDMLYKVLILYKDPELQQRWISEIAQLTHFDAIDIIAVVNERKIKLKMFQKKI